MNVDVVHVGDAELARVLGAERRVVDIVTLQSVMSIPMERRQLRDTGLVNQDWEIDIDGFKVLEGLHKGDQQPG